MEVQGWRCVNYVDERCKKTSKLVLRKGAVMKHLEGEWINEEQCKGNLNKCPILC